jgi:signal transduction histidine kinase
MIQKTGIGKEKRKMTEELVIHQKKMDALATLANGIAHDFNNILSGIVGYSEVALSMAENDKPVTNIIDRILDACERAKTLIDPILAFSRRNWQAGDEEPIRMAPVIMEVIELVKASLPPDIELRANIACHDGIIFSSKAMIHKAVMNLCLNSIQAMKDKGGTLAIELKETEVAQASAETDNIAPGRYLMLSVSDTGPGIPEEIMDRIFDPYFTTKGNGEGTGLGLSVVYGVIKNYKGAVKVKSAPGEKTTFEILLPQIDIHNLS